MVKQASAAASGVYVLQREAVGGLIPIITHVSLDQALGLLCKEDWEPADRFTLVHVKRYRGGTVKHVRYVGDVVVLANGKASLLTSDQVIPAEERTQKQINAIGGLVNAQTESIFGT